MHLQKLLKGLLLFSCLSFVVSACDEDVVDVNPCEDIICENGGTCSEGICICPEGFSGTLCEIEDVVEDPCEDIVCQNGGTCSEGICICPEGYSGPFCEIEDVVADPCEDIICQNGGTCSEGICVCPDGFSGTLCELIDIQLALDAGTTPKSLYDIGVPLDALYGKNYLDGLLFYLNTSDGTGMVAALADQSSGTDWSCEYGGLAGVSEVLTSPTNPETEVGARIGDGAVNTDAILAQCTMGDGIAAKLCRDLGEEWFLPSRGELNQMYTNLHLNGYGNFSTGYDFYWTSTAFINNLAWLQSFENGNQTNLPVSFISSVRAARAF